MFQQFLKKEGMNGNSFGWCFAAKASMIRGMDSIRQIIAKRVLVIAEIGINHNGSVDQAYALLEKAAACGADAVKWQMFSAREMVSRRAPGVSHAQAKGMLDLFGSLQLPVDCWPGLRQRARELAVNFGCSLFDFEALSWAKDLELDFLKIASGELTDRPLLQASFPLTDNWIVSTGASTASEIAALLEWLHAQGRQDPILLECTSAYPAKAGQIHLGNIAWMRDCFSVCCGFSDHSLGMHIPLAAVAAGARVIEKHFTLDRNQAGPDHLLSMDPSGFAAMTASIREVETALTTTRKAFVPSWEEETRQKGRKSVVAARELPAGTVLHASDLNLKRPGVGISPLHYHELPGRKLKNAVETDQTITWDMLE